MTAEVDTFIKDVSTTRTNIAAARRSISRGLPEPPGSLRSSGLVLMSPFRLMCGVRSPPQPHIWSSSTRQHKWG